MSGKSRQGSGSRSNRLRVQEAARRRAMATGLIVFAAVPAAALAGFWFWASQPMPRPARPIRLRIPSRSGVLQVGNILQHEGVVRSAVVFAISSRIDGKGAALKAGNYKFSGELTLDSVIARLSDGPNDLAQDAIRITVPEGYTLSQIGKLLADRGVLDPGQFEQFAANPQAISGVMADFPLPRTSLEGYLYPDTYDLLPHSSPEQIANQMLLNFSKRFYRPYQHEIGAAAGGLNDLVIKASLIEREARTEQDRPIIAGVLDNRLKKGMKLQIDATVLYGRDHKARITDGDLKKESPYNTYLHPGLPPGPIANPGMNSLLAALHPGKSDYLYYVARPTGSHTFTRTFAEHEKAVAQARAEWKAGGGSVEDHYHEQR